MEISRKQRSAIPALLGTGSLEDVARTTGISVRTLKRWLKDRAFRKFLWEAMDARLQAALRDTAADLAAVGPMAVQALRRVLENPREASPELSVRAAGVVADKILRLLELENKKHDRSKRN